MIDINGQESPNHNHKKELYPERSRNLMGKINLRGVKVNGDVYLVSDKKTGPSIDAELAFIGGRLDIYPIDDPSTDDTKKINQSWNDYRKKINKEYKEERSGNRKFGDIPININLESAQSKVFCHPFTAWPEMGGLRLTGFTYSRTDPLGPLSPPPKSNNTIVNANWRTRVFSRIRGFPIVYAVAYSLIFGSICVYYTRILSLFGPINTLLVLVLLGYNAIIWIARSRPPVLRSSEPMAITYLRLQEAAENRFRLRPYPYRPLDPFVQAAMALRAEGRYISANLVEEERLRQRADMLSWRHHTLAKVGLILADWVSCYGFRVSRTILLFASAIIIASSLSFFAMSNGLLEPVQPCVGGEECAAAPVDPGSAQALNASALSYSIEHLLPLVTLGEGDRWVAASPGHRAASGGASGWVQDLCASASVLAVWWPSILRILGLFFTTAIAWSLAVRVQSAFSRVQE
ncbi:MAG: hypothetical protein ACK534_05530 [Phenylobacterium sp.]|jgi:hypothetical protein|uniref:hypothetical protein n=1 Tax=Phenylobacterium sp. TaxID=1871053 RepID=UPI00391EE7AF